MAEKLVILFVDDDPAEELILRSLMKRVEGYEIELLYCRDMAGALAQLKEENQIFMVLLDNKLGPGEDFRGTVPQLRQSGFTGPVGVISSSIEDSYFQSFEEYGADFRIDKAEFDPTAVEFIIREFMEKSVSPI